MCGFQERRSHTPFFLFKELLCCQARHGGGPKVVLMVFKFFHTLPVGGQSCVSGSQVPIASQILSPVTALLVDPQLSRVCRRLMFLISSLTRVWFPAAWNGNKGGVSKQKLITSLFPLTTLWFYTFSLFFLAWALAALEGVFLFPC